MLPIPYPPSAFRMGCALIHPSQPLLFYAPLLNTDRTLLSIPCLQQRQDHCRHQVRAAAHWFRDQYTRLTHRLQLMKFGNQVVRLAVKAPPEICRTRSALADSFIATAVSTSPSAWSLAKIPDLRCWLSSRCASRWMQVAFPAPKNPPIKMNCRDSKMTDSEEVVLTVRY